MTYNIYTNDNFYATCGSLTAVYSLVASLEKYISKDKIKVLTVI